MVIKSKINLAHNIAKAAFTREDSWNVDIDQYTKTLTDCCYEVCSDKDEANIVFMLLEMSWSDAVDWADNVLAKYNK